ncbi:MAG: hypothetical protein ACK4GN_03790 [Runella sp.]
MTLSSSHSLVPASRFLPSAFSLLPFIFCLLPIVLYWVFFHSIALNVNYIAYDDLHVLQIIDQWKNASSWVEKLDWLTVGFPEHRIVFTRSVVLISYFLTGAVHLKNLMIVSNLLWFGQWFIVGLVLKKALLNTQSFWLAFVPVCWILMGVHSFENMFWGTSSLGNFGLLFFVMLAAYGFAQNLLTIALIFSFLATFSYGNGLLTFLIGGIVLALGKQWRQLLQTLVTFAFTMLLYAFTRAHASPSGLDLTQWSNYGKALLCFFAFVGSSVNADVYAPSEVAVWASVVWGGVLVGMLTWYFGRHCWKHQGWGNHATLQRFAFFLFLFVCITALGVVYKRAEGDGLLGMFKGRYRMYPTWLLLVGYLVLIVEIPKPRLRKYTYAFCLFASVLFNLSILYYAVASAVNNRRMAIVQEFNSLYNNDLLGLKMFDMTGEDFKHLRNYYRPKLFFDKNPEVFFPIKTTGNFGLDKIQFDGDLLRIAYHQGYITPTQDFDDGAYIIFQSAERTYMASGLQTALPPKTFVRRGMYWNKGFTATIHRASVHPGSYKVFVLLRQNGQNQFYDTQKQMSF